MFLTAVGPGSPFAGTFSFGTDGTVTYTNIPPRGRK